DGGDGILRRIGLVGVDRQVDVVADAFANRFHTGDVEIDFAVDLDLEIAIALRNHLRGIGRHVGRRLDRNDPQEGDAISYLAAQQVVEWNAKAARAQVV